MHPEHRTQIGDDHRTAPRQRTGQGCRDLGGAEPFDFVTWFEFAPADTGAFNELLAALRASPEWQYVDREVDIRLKQASG